jgi:hypothetical protein
MRMTWASSWTNAAAFRGLVLGIAILPLAAGTALAQDVEPAEEPRSEQPSELEFRWDTTVSYGLAFRIADRNLDIVGLTNGGRAFSVNGDDGNLNYDKGIYSNALKATSEAELRYKKRFGAFVRGFAYYDYENEEGDRARTPLSEDALDRVGTRIELRDAFAFAGFDLGSVPVELRVGRQVVSWGESTFIQNGINVINPIDVSALRVPGSELREGLLPVGIAWTSIGLTKAISIEGFYQFEWEPTIIDPSGTYFSTSDLAGRGGSRVMLGFGAVPDLIAIAPVPTNPIGFVVQRQADVEADDQGQYGAAMRFFVDSLGGTEFGLYFVNYHSRLPLINAVTGQFGAVLPPGTPGGVAPGLNYAASARYFQSYPEDIKLFGASFNTQLGRTGIALQGEVAHRKDVPLQVDDLELLYAALTPLRRITIPSFVRLAQVGGLLAQTGQLGAYEFSTATAPVVIEGYRRFDTTQYQMTATKIFANLLGADQATLVAEGAVSTVHDMPDKSTLRLDGPGTYTSGNAIHQQAGVQPGTEPESAFPDATSWGYVVAGRLEYNNAFSSVNLIPRFSWAHDVKGVSPGPGGNFLEGRKALTVGLTANYKINWEFDVSYTAFSGAGRYNLIADRDFLATNVKFSF